MKTLNLPLSALIVSAIALPLSAQTAAHHTPATTHSSATAAHHTSAASGCVKVPEFSPKIPALSPGLPCPKALYTLTHVPDTHLDYASPMISSALREELAGSKTTYSLDYIDTKIGTGALAEPGKFYTVHYTGYLADGSKFDSSVDRGEPITFPYGQHRVIPGWDTGFEGMHVGGKRRLFIPYELAYGEAGRPPVIPAKAELIFDVEFIAQGDQMPKPKAPPMPRRPTPPSGATEPATAIKSGAAGQPASNPPAPPTPPPATPAGSKPQQ